MGGWHFLYLGPLGPFHWLILAVVLLLVLSRPNFRG